MKWFVLLVMFAAGAAQAAQMTESRHMIGLRHMTELRYVDQDPGDPPYATRILVTPDYLRMDTGEDDGDFVLLDRRQHKAFNVMRESRLAMVFVPATLPPRPESWKSRLLVKPHAKGAQRYRLLVNGQTCSEGVADRRAVPDAARAMAELKTVLAATQYRVWRDTPVELRHDCDLANLVWEADSTLRMGLTLEEREFNGRSRTLQGRSSVPLKPELFRLPDGFVEMPAPGL